jgi:tetratricopeptide (TPR) repeat protein
VLDARTYSDANVAAFVNEKLISIKIDAEKGEGIEIAKRYDVQAFPTILVIKSNGDEIDRVLGFVEAGPFLNTMKEYVNGVNTFGLLKAQLESDPSDPDLTYKLSKKYLDRYEQIAATEHFRRLIELDPDNLLGHNDEAEFNIAGSSLRDSKDPSRLVVFSEKYPQSELAQQALYSLWRHYINAKDGENASEYFTRFTKRWPNNASMMNNYAWTCAEQGINLDQAAEVAKKAVELATKDDERAMYLDTYATVEFTRGNVEEAIRLEQHALDLLKDAAPKERKVYEETMAKFRTALPTGDAN